MNLHIGNLDHSTSEERLRVLFTSYGLVTEVLIFREKETGISCGFGCVQMPDHSQAHRAIEHLNGAKLDTQVITVEPARPRLAMQHSSRKQ